MARVRVPLWDLPTRIVHWSLAAMIGVSWWSAEQHDMERHRASGYVILGLLVFRLIWGVIGSSTARFGGFVRGPRSVIAYARGRTPAGLGHNPLGGWSVVAMLLVLGLQVGLGLFAIDADGIESGPLTHLVSYETADRIADIHEALFNLLLALIVLHLLAILYYLLVRRDNLIGPMVGGAKYLDAAPAAPPTMASLGRALAAAAVAAAVAWWVAQGLPIPV